VRYRPFFMCGKGRVKTGRDVEAPADDEALNLARGLGNPHALDVWRGTAYVGRVEGASRSRRAPES